MRNAAFVRIDRIRGVKVRDVLTSKTFFFALDHYIVSLLLYDGKVVMTRRDYAEIHVFTGLTVPSGIEETVTVDGPGIRPSSDSRIRAIRRAHPDIS